MRAIASSLPSEPDERDHLVDVARVRVHAGEVRDRLADLDVPVQPGALQHDPDARAQRSRALAGIEAEHGDLAGAAVAVALEDLDGRRLAGAVGTEQPEDLAALHGEVDPADGLEVAVGLSQTVDLDRDDRSQR